MIVAVTYSNGNVNQVFGNTRMFKIYDVEDRIINSTQMVECKTNDIDGRYEALNSVGADVLICGGIAMDGRMLMNKMGIRIIEGVSGDVESAIQTHIVSKMRPRD